MNGVFWAVGAAVIFSLGHVAIRKSVGVLGVRTGTAVMLVVATLAVGLAALALDELAVLAAASWTGVLYFAIAGLIHYVGGWGFMNSSVRLIGAARMSAITGISPLFAAVLAITTLNESLNLLIGFGILLIVAGAFLIAGS